MMYIVPNIRVVRITIQLTSRDKQQTETRIVYTQTGLTEKGNVEVEKFTEDRFHQQMDYWEKAINFYLIHGKLISSDEHYLASHK